MLKSRTPWGHAFSKVSHSHIGRRQSCFGKAARVLTFLLNGVMDFLRFGNVPWGGSRSVDFSAAPGFGSGRLPKAVSNSAEASVLERLRTY